MTVVSVLETFHAIIVILIMTIIGWLCNWLRSLRLNISQPIVITPDLPMRAKGPCLQIR
jgi:hypothetical protein